MIREDKFKTELKETLCEAGRWMKLAQDHVLWQLAVVLNLRD
jgi:hypothetical protein